VRRGRGSSEAPSHLALREERAGPGGLLHPDPLRRALELVLALVRAEEVAALLVLAAGHALAALDAHAADGVVRLPRNLLPLARVHRLKPPVRRHRPLLISAACAFSHSGSCCSILQRQRRTVSCWTSDCGAPPSSFPGYALSHCEGPRLPVWPAPGRHEGVARPARIE